MTGLTTLLLLAWAAPCAQDHALDGLWTGSTTAHPGAVALDLRGDALAFVEPAYVSVAKVRFGPEAKEGSARAWPVDVTEVRRLSRDGSERPQAAQPVWLGTVKLEGDRLRMCLAAAGQPRSAIVAVPRSGTLCWDMARAAPACVPECVHRNQARAVAPEQIERDCREECGARP